MTQVRGLVTAKVIIEMMPPVYDPERYRRGLAILTEGYKRALVKELREGKNDQEPEAA